MRVLKTSFPLLNDLYPHGRLGCDKEPFQCEVADLIFSLLMIHCFNSWSLIPLSNEQERHAKQTGLSELQISECHILFIVVKFTVP